MRYKVFSYYDLFWLAVLQNGKMDMKFNFYLFYLF